MPSCTLPPPQVLHAPVSAPPTRSASVHLHPYQPASSPPTVQGYKEGEQGKEPGAGGEGRAAGGEAGGEGATAAVAPGGKEGAGILEQGRVTFLYRRVAFGRGRVSTAARQCAACKVSSSMLALAGWSEGHAPRRLRPVRWLAGAPTASYPAGPLNPRPRPTRSVFLLSFLPQANAITHLGQPALLYLCPLTLGSVALVGAQRKDLQKLWSFTDTTAASGGGKKQQQAAGGGKE